MKAVLDAEMRKMKALENIKKLLGKVDNRAETIPATDPGKLYSLLKDLKGGELSKEEETVLNEIVRA